MTPLPLPVRHRSPRESSRKIRTLKQVPAVVYGHGLETKHVAVDSGVFRRAFHHASYSMLLDLDLDGKEKIPALVHEVQYDPVTESVLHVDFYAVRMDEKIKTHVPLKFFGFSEAVKQGAVLNTNKHDVEITCLPNDLIHEIPVDLSKLEKLNDAIHVKDLALPPGITLVSAPEDLVVSAVVLKVIVEEAPVVEAAVAVPGAEGAAAPAAGAEGAEAGKPGTEGEKGAAKKEEAAGAKPGAKKEEGKGEKKK